MVGVLQRFERRIEGLVNGAFARAFKAEVQPVEIAAALQRECDGRAAIVGRGRTMVPNVFVIELSSDDHARLEDYGGPMCGELADMVRDHAAEQGYSFVGPVQVTLERQEDLETGRFRVRGRAIAGTGSAAHDAPTDGAGTDGAPYLDISGERFPLTRPVTVIGRSGEADLRISDPGVSRRHAEVRLHPTARDAVLVVDLDSTNGVLVAGQRVPHAELRDGDQVVLGNTSIVFHAGPR